MIIEVGQALLAKRGYRVLVARSGAEAIAVYQASQRQIDLVLLDMIMPDVSGSQVFDAIQATGALIGRTGWPGSFGHGARSVAMVVAKNRLFRSAGRNQRPPTQKLIDGGGRFLPTGATVITILRIFR